jgi:CHAT domain-containing protein/Tfp pilus assembly protein PilF
MTGRATCGLALLLALATAAVPGDEKPPWQRMLQGDDAAKAAELKKQSEQLMREGRFTEAVAPAETLLALREARQGKDHWETVNTRLLLDLAQQAAREPAPVQKAFAQSLRQQLEAERLEAQGKDQEAEPIRVQGLSLTRKILGEAHPVVAWPLNSLAKVHWKLGKLKEAEDDLRKMLEIQLKALPPGHPDLAQSYNNLGLVQWNQGKLQEAEESQRKGLEMRLKALPSGHPDLAQSYSNLALIQRNLGKWKEVEESLRKLLEIQLQSLPAGHSDLAQSYNNLGLVQQNLGKLKEAEENCRKGLEIALKALPAGNPNIATIYNNLGLIQGDLGKLKDAEQSHRKALEMRRKALPAGHPDIAQSYNNLGRVQQALGQWKEAEESVRAALEIRLKVLPAGHPDIAQSYNNLGRVQQNLGKLKEAEESVRTALEIALKALPPGHPNLATIYNNLGLSQWDMGKLKEAEESHRKALEIRLKVLPAGHPDIAQSYSNLGTVQWIVGKLKEAEESQRKALEIQLNALPAGHPDIAQSYNNLSLIERELGKLKEAEENSRRALELRLKALPAGHPDLAQSYNHLGLIQRDLGKLKEAEENCRQALELRLKALPAGHSDIAQSYNILGLVQWNQGKLQEAEESHRKVLEIALKALPAGHPNIATGYNNLGAVQTDLGKLKEAEENSRKALEIALQGLPPGHPTTADSYTNLATIQQALGKPKEAEKLLRSGGAAFEVARIRVGPGSSERVHLALRHSPYDLWSACLVRLGQPDDAWQAAETNRARGLLDDLAARLPKSGSSLRERRVRLDQLDQLILPLILAGELKSEDQARLKELRRERDELLDTLAREAAEQSRRAVYPLAAIQKQVPPDVALVLWIDLPDLPNRAEPRGDHWACVVRSSGPPRWVQLDGSGDKGAWTASDLRLPFNLRHLLAIGSPDWNDLARRLHDQRLKPLGPHLQAAGDLPAVRHLVVIPTGLMAGVPVELLTDRSRVSYAPSGTLFVRLREQHRPLTGESLLALGDPAFAPPDRNRGESFKPLPATRREVQQIAGLFPQKSTVTLLGTDASEQRLDALAGETGGLKRFRVLHLATHGVAGDLGAEHSFLAVASDKLPGLTGQQLVGQKVYDGRLTVEEIGTRWELDADLVTLSACLTALGPDGGGEGLRGFAQVLFKAGARSLVLSLWRVDDTATALLMVRFYENLLGQREGLKAPLPRAEALREAKQWLRELPRKDAEALAVALGKGELRGSVSPLKPLAEPPKEAVGQKGDRPFAHPYYWAAFILLGDPD